MFGKAKNGKSAPSEFPLIYDLASGCFPPVDVEQVKDDMDLERLAIEDGEQDVPALDKARKYEAADAIDAHLGGLIARAKSDLLVLLQEMGNLIMKASAEVESAPQKILDMYEETKQEIQIGAATQGNENEFVEARRELVQAKNALNNFKKRHEGDGPADFPESIAWPLLWILYFAVIEILVNSYALGTAHPNGPAGVAIEILLFTVVNVGVAFLLGYYVWRWVFHISGMVKLCGVLAGLFMAGFIILINLLLAHYRDALSELARGLALGPVTFGGEDLDYLAQVTQLGGLAMERVLGTPLMIEDFKSYLLLGVGVLAAVVVTIKSFGLDDPYPGYGKVTRNYLERTRRYAEKQEQYNQDLVALVNDCVKEINALVERCDGYRADIATKIQKCKQLPKEYGGWLLSVRAAGKQLYAFYEKENMRARAGMGESPACFGRFEYVLPEEAEEVAAPEVADISPSLTQEIRENVKKYKAELHGLRDRNLENVPAEKVSDTPSAVKAEEEA